MDDLPEELLDILAYDLHVDWYQESYPIDVKRAVIRDSVRVHRRMGTRYAVETAVRDVYPDSEIHEWFSYGGAPHTFRLVLHDVERPMLHPVFREVREALAFYKPVRSQLEKLILLIETFARVKIGRGFRFTARASIGPWTITRILLNGKHSLNGAFILSVVYERGPHFQGMMSKEDKAALDTAAGNVDTHNESGNRTRISGCCWQRLRDG